MGKIRTRFLGEEEVEKQQIKEQKERSQAKKTTLKVWIKLGAQFLMI